MSEFVLHVIQHIVTSLPSTGHAMMGIDPIACDMLHMPCDKRNIVSDGRKTVQCSCAISMMSCIFVFIRVVRLPCGCGAHRCGNTRTTSTTGTRGPAISVSLCEGKCKTLYMRLNLLRPFYCVSMCMPEWMGIHEDNTVYVFYNKCIFGAPVGCVEILCC